MDYLLSLWVMWSKCKYGYAGKYFFFQFSSKLTGVQTINYIHVETSATVKAVKTKESSASQNASFSFVRAKVWEGGTIKEQIYEIYIHATRQPDSKISWDAESSHLPNKQFDEVFLRPWSNSIYPVVCAPASPLRFEFCTAIQPTVVKTKSRMSTSWWS